MALTRRSFLTRGTKMGLAVATTSFWMNPLSRSAFGQMTGNSYRAIVVITMVGGNDGNNMIVPMDPASYTEYARIRGPLALASNTLNTLSTGSGPTYGLHPSLVNVSRLFNQQRAAVVANVGPITAPVAKKTLLAGSSAYPDSLFSHPNGIAQWESASAYNGSITGWGGRLGDLLIAQAGKLPPVLNAGVQSLFADGASVQAVAVQGGGAFPALPSGLQAAIDRIAEGDLTSDNSLVQEAAKVRRASLAQQAIITQATAYRSLKTTFPGDGFGKTMQTIAQLVAGNSIIGATRQIFYTQQGSYDSHAEQLPAHAGNLSSLDQGLGAFFQALDEMGMSDQVLVCTHSDFNRTFAPNSSGGSDHAWGNHQLILGGGIAGGKILGKMPAIDLNGSDDLNGLGIWVPTTSVSQLAGGIGAWMGLNSAQINTVCPELQNFANGRVSLT